MVDLHSKLFDKAFHKVLTMNVNLDLIWSCQRAAYLLFRATYPIYLTTYESIYNALNSKYHTPNPAAGSPTLNHKHSILRSKGFRLNS